MNMGRGTSLTMFSAWYNQHLTGQIILPFIFYYFPDSYEGKIKSKWNFWPLYFPCVMLGSIISTKFTSKFLYCEMLRSPLNHPFLNPHIDAKCECTWDSPYKEKPSTCIIPLVIIRTSWDFHNFLGEFMLRMLDEAHHT